MFIFTEMRPSLVTAGIGYSLSIFTSFPLTKSFPKVPSIKLWPFACVKTEVYYCCFSEWELWCLFQQGSVIESSANLGIHGQGLLKLSGPGDSLRAQRLFLSLFYTVHVSHESAWNYFGWYRWGKARWAFVIPISLTKFSFCGALQIKLIC